MHAVAQENGHLLLGQIAMPMKNMIFFLKKDNSRMLCIISMAGTYRILQNHASVALLFYRSCQDLHGFPILDHEIRGLTDHYYQNLATM